MLRRLLAITALVLAVGAGLVGPVATAGAEAATSAQQPGTADGTTATTDRRLPRTNDELDQLDDGEHLDSIWVFASAVGCAALVGGGGWWLKRRMDAEARQDREREQAGRG